jgi:hypothetical protein
MELDVKNYDFTNNRPQTDFYNDMRELNIPLMVKFFEKFVFDHHDSTQKAYNYKSNLLFSQFNEFIKSGNFKYEMTATKFGNEIKDIKGITKERKRDGQYYIIEFEQLKIYLTETYNFEFHNNFIDSDDEEDEDE